ncbi:hypothetical protein ABG79_00651 [Caloramator mitchellensis]|uniref:Uncharacterized protein n=1 Tax=Caloramator mitchellensis TaxID=908809 RepID=A0A0R3JUW6_CALMK|nr:hypothetical protein [Caloramator mitchellensis]KRQ87313.1 hypothetical protein ABG79_00651 [Caloramator mitchellensis]
MNKLQSIKEDIQRKVDGLERYEIESIKSIEHPIKRDLMSFNIVFSDKEKSVRYNVVGYENEKGEVGILIECPILTGIKDDLHIKENVNGFELEIKNFSKGKEALIKLNCKVKDDEFNFDMAMDTIIEHGINRMIY